MKCVNEKSWIDPFKTTEVSQEMSKYWDFLAFFIREKVEIVTKYKKNIV